MTREELIEYLAERLVAGLAAAGWSHSLYHPDFIGRDMRTLVHLSFAIGIGSTFAHPSAKPEDGAHSNTRVRVRWVHRLAADGQGGQLEDYKAALRAEQALLKAAVDETVRPELSLWVGGDVAEEPKILGSDGTYVSGTTWFVTGHILPLQD